MNVAPDTSGSWSRGRWWLAVVLVCAVQFGLIFALGERRPPASRPVGDPQRLGLAVTHGELLELQDPTLFAMPHARGFSGESWRRAAAVTFPAFHWSEPTRPLSLPVARLGEGFHRFMQTNVFASFTLEAKPAPEIQAPDAGEIVEALPAASRLEIAGGFTSIRLLNPPTLRAWRNSELLTNTVVQALVDADGNVLSASTLPPGSGLPDADRLAFDLTRGFRFGPVAAERWLANPLREMTRGCLIFHWRTEPPATTNPPALSPSP